MFRIIPYVSVEFFQVFVFTINLWTELLKQILTNSKKKLDHLKFRLIIYIYL